MRWLLFEQTQSSVSTPLLVIVVSANAIGAAIGLGLILVKGAEGRQKLPLGTFLGVCGLVAVVL